MTQVLYSVKPSWDVRWCKSIPEARHAMTAELPDLLITDCLLGDGENGIEFWEQCRRYFPDIPFLMVTGLGPQTLQKLKTAEKTELLPELLQKPFSFKALKTRVQTLMEANTA